MQRAGLGILVVMALLAGVAPLVSPNAPSAQHRSHPLAPPMLPTVRGAHGEWQRPHVASLRLTDRLTHRYERGAALPLVWLSDRTLVRSASPGQPLLLLGSDPLGRDVWSRLVHGARYSLGLAALAVAGAILLGTIIGLLAGSRVGALDGALMGIADVFIVLPALYVVLLFRASLPLVLEPATLFALMAAVLTLAGWPSVARGVRAIAATERQRDYVVAAVALGAGRWRVMSRHLLPATRPFLATQAVLLLPAFIVAEATLSFISLGFSEPTPSWGTLLQDTYRSRVLFDAPWLFAPAAAIAMVTVAANLVREGQR